jgi:PKD repeat protein
VKAALVIAIAVSFLLPLTPSGVSDYPVRGIEGTQPPQLAQAESVIAFPSQLNTSLNISEYPLVSRALMLSGGSTDASLADLDYDGQTDLLVGVSDSKLVSVFYRQADGTFPTYESFNVSLTDNPIKVAAVDAFASGNLQIMAFERAANAFDSDHIEIFNMTTATSYSRIMDRIPDANASDIVIGNFTGDKYPDIAVASSGINPSTTPGRVKVMQGFLYSDYVLLRGGNGTNALAAGDFDSDGLDELAVANYYDSTVILYHQPFWDFMPAYARLNLTGAPVDLVAGNFNSDIRTDLAVITQAPSELCFFYQSLGYLPEAADYSVSMRFAPSGITVGDLNGDLRADLALVSEPRNVSFGFYGSGTDLWPSAPDFEFPVSGVPRSSLIGDLDGDAQNDLAVASARPDWSGSHIAIYPARSPTFSNSNATTWMDPSDAYSMIAVGDLNGDAVEDLVLMNHDAGSFDYQLSFDSVVRLPISLGYVPSHILVEDFNNDGFSDVLTTMSGGSTVTITFGGNPFPSRTTQLTCNGGIMDVALGDFNSDSLQDFLIATDDGRFDFFNNSGQAEPFGAPYEFAPTLGAGIWSVVAGDFNSDGLTDVAYTHSIRKITILFQSRSVPFGLASDSVNLSHSVGSDFTSIWSGDVTGDGKTDIVAMRQSDPSMYLFDQTMFRSSPHPYGTLTFPEVPKFVSVLDATDRGYADVVAIFNSADLLFLYRQEGGTLPSTPSMTFVTGAGPNYAVIGDGTRDHRGDLLVNEIGSHTVSMWSMINVPPVVHAGGPYAAREGDLLQLNGTVTTGTSEIPFMNYTWDFGDGSPLLVGRYPRPVHNYTSIGTDTMRNYTINVTVRDPANLTSTDHTWVNVYDAYPHVAFIWTPLNPREGQMVNFTDNTYSFDGFAAITWKIDGVITPRTDHNLSVEMQNGNHTITLEITDLDGTVGNRSSMVEVRSSPPDLRIVAPPSADEGQAVTFTVLVDEWHGGPVDPIISYEWDFSYVTGIFIPDPYAANSNTTTHNFSTDANPSVCRVAVNVTDSDGESNISTWDILIFDVGPVANLTLSTTDPQEGVPFSFISLCTSFDGIVEWNWTLMYPDGHNESYSLDDSEMAALEFADLQDGSYTMLLTVAEADGNRSYHSLPFHVREIPPFVNLTSLPVPRWDGYYEEFFSISFFANVTGLDPAVLFEWDFNAPGAEFRADFVGTTRSSKSTYTQVGNYTVKVRVTDSGGSTSIQPLSVEIRQSPLGGDFGMLVTFARDFSNTSYVSFSLLPLMAVQPDVVRAFYDFGDNSTMTVDDDLLATVNHTYALGSDYRINITVTDDDGYSFLISTIIGNQPPTIRLLSPGPDSVVRSGTPLLFLISPGSQPLFSSGYHLDGSGPQPFLDLYEIGTTGWTQSTHSVLLVAVDQGSCVVRFRTSVTIDDVTPNALLSSDRLHLFGGARINITVKVDDPNVVANGIVLYVRFQGESAFSSFTVSRHDSRTFYRVLQLPTSEGNISFYADVSDLAGNSVRTPLYSQDVKLHFMTAAWPYLLAAAVLASISTAGYFMREGRIAVDETFVIYKDGRLISHTTRRLKPGMDDQVLGSMFVAIQDFVKDSFKDLTSFTLRRLDFGEKSIVIEKGDHLYVAAVLHGAASHKVASRMEKIADEIEERFEEELKEWDGDLDKLRGVNDIVKTLYSRMPTLPGSLWTGET